MITEIPADLNNLLEKGAGQKFFDRDIIPWKPNDQEKTIEYHGYMIKEVEHYGGEGQGSSYWTVYSFTKNDETFYISFNGWYESYSGSVYSDYSLVEPKQKTITVYEDVKA